MVWQLTLIDWGCAALLSYAFIFNNPNIDSIVGITAGVLLLQGIIELRRK